MVHIDPYFRCQNVNSRAFAKATQNEIYTVICFIFVVKIFLFASQKTKIIYSNVMLHKKIFTTNIYKNRSYELYIYWVYLHVFRCVPVAGISLSLLFPFRNQG